MQTPAMFTEEFSKWKPFPVAHEDVLEEMTTQEREKYDAEQDEMDRRGREMWDDLNDQEECR